MNDFSPELLLLRRAVFEALPVGLCVYDDARRLMMATDRFCEAIGLTAGSLRLGSALEDNLRGIAYRGLLGPGDPEALAESLLALGFREAHRLVRLQSHGRTFDLHLIVQDDGGYLACSVEVTADLSAREASERATARLVQACHGLRIGLAVFSPDRLLTLSNRAFAQLLGLPPQALVPGLPFAALIRMMRAEAAAGDRGDTQQDEALLALSAAGTRSRLSGLRMQRSNGQIIDIGSDQLADGGWTVTVTDVSNLTYAEESARARLTTLGTLLDCLPEGVMVVGPDRRVALVNRTYADMMQDAPAVVGETVEQLIMRQAMAGEFGHGIPEDLVRRELSFEDGRPRVRKRRRPNGRMVESRTVPLPDGGQLTIVTDVTALDTAETELSRRAGEMATMLGAIRHGIVLWDRDHRVVASNAVASELLDQPGNVFTPGRAHKDVLDDLLSDDRFGGGLDAAITARDLLARDRSIAHVHHRVTPSGRVLEVHSGPAPGGGFVVTYTDVTQQRGAAEELGRAKAMAEGANAAKSRFLATMSHELRTPLNAVIGFSDTLAREAVNHPTPELVSEYAQAINGAGRQLLNLIDTILDVARIEAGRLDLAADLVEVPRLLRSCLKQVDPTASAADVDIVVNAPHSLPLVEGDERRLRQAISQLLSNAVKFTRPGGRVQVIADVVGERTERHEPSDRQDRHDRHNIEGLPIAMGQGDMTLSVIDNGIGIPETELERVFEPFLQIDGTLARRFQGAGLGLYISRALVRAHGGELTLTSRLGEGTIATIRLPASRVRTRPRPLDDFHEEPMPRS